MYWSFARLRNDLLCVGWGVKLYSLTPMYVMYYNTTQSGQCNANCFTATVSLKHACQSMLMVFFVVILETTQRVQTSAGDFRVYAWLSVGTPIAK